MTQQLIDERRNLNRMAQDQLRAIKTLIGDEGFSRTQEIRHQKQQLLRTIRAYHELSTMDNDTPQYMMDSHRQNFEKYLGILNLPKPTAYDGNADYIQLLNNKHGELSELIKVEFPEHADQILTHYSEYDNLTMRSNAIKASMNSTYGHSV